MVREKPGLQGAYSMCIGLVGANSISFSVVTIGLVGASRPCFSGVGFGPVPGFPVKLEGWLFF